MKKMVRLKEDLPYHLFVIQAVLGRNIIIKCTGLSTNVAHIYHSVSQQGNKWRVTGVKK